MTCLRRRSPSLAVESFSYRLGETSVGAGAPLEPDKVACHGSVEGPNYAWSWNDGAIYSRGYRGI